MSNQNTETSKGYLEIAVSVAMGNQLKYILLHLLKEHVPNQKKWSEKLIWKLCRVALIRPGAKTDFLGGSVTYSRSPATFGIIKTRIQTSRHQSLVPSVTATTDFLVSSLITFFSEVQSPVNNPIQPSTKRSPHSQSFPLFFFLERTISKCFQLFKHNSTTI